MGTGEMAGLAYITAMNQPVISIVSPVYNEEAGLAEFTRQVVAALTPLNDSFEIVLVNDGSTDNSLAVAMELSRQDSRVKVVSFSRNFGHEAASSAGLRYARGQAVVLIDSDLQDPPEVIVEMIRRWREGFQIVYGQRVRREQETALKRSTSWVFYRLMQRLAGIDLPRDTGDFRLMDRRVVDAFNALPERNRFVRGLVAWTGFRSVAAPFERQPRFAGATKYNYWKLTSLAIDSLTSFSTVPLRVATWLGLLVAMGALFWVVVVLLQFFMIKDYRPPGFTFLYIAVLLLSGVQIFLMGLIGEYLGRTYEEVQRRPLYIVDQLIGFADTPARSGPNGGLSPAAGPAAFEPPQFISVGRITAAPANSEVRQPGVENSGP